MVKVSVIPPAAPAYSITLDLTAAQAAQLRLLCNYVGGCQGSLLDVLVAVDVKLGMAGVPMAGKVSGSMFLE